MISTVITTLSPPPATHWRIGVPFLHYIKLLFLLLSPNSTSSGSLPCSSGCSGCMIREYTLGEAISQLEALFHGNRYERRRVFIFVDPVNHPSPQRDTGVVSSHAPPDVAPRAISSSTQRATSVGPVDAVSAAPVPVYRYNPDDLTLMGPDVPPPNGMLLGGISNISPARVRASLEPTFRTTDGPVPRTVRRGADMPSEYPLRSPPRQHNSAGSDREKPGRRAQTTYYESEPPSTGTSKYPRMFSRPAATAVQPRDVSPPRHAQTPRPSTRTKTAASKTSSSPHSGARRTRDAPNPFFFASALPHSATTTDDGRPRGRRGVAWVA